MAILSEAFSRAPGMRSLSAALEVQSSAEDAFSLLCAVEKWPVWLSLVRSVELKDPTVPLGPGSEVLVRAAIPGQAEQLFEVDQFITNHHLSLVGAYSVRRRIDFRVERKTTRSKLHVRVEYPAYNGKMGALYDALRFGRRLSAQLAESVTHFKHLVEYTNAKDELLADF